MKYAFIEANRHEHKVSRLCEVMEVSRSGYYGWRERRPSSRAMEDAELLQRIQAIHIQYRQAYGTLKVWKTLSAQGIRCGKHRVARIRRRHGIETLRKRLFRRSYAARNYMPPASNLLRKKGTDLFSPRCLTK